MYDIRLPVNDSYFEDLEAELEHQRYQEARDALDPSDVLAEVQSLMLAISDDAQHPLFALVRQCVEHGTTHESGRSPHVAAQVGEALIPLIERAIGRLVQEALLVDDRGDPREF